MVRVVGRSPGPMGADSAPGHWARKQFGEAPRSGATVQRNRVCIGIDDFSEQHEKRAIRCLSMRLQACASVHLRAAYLGLFPDKVAVVSPQCRRPIDSSPIQGRKPSSGPSSLSAGTEADGILPSLKQPGARQQLCGCAAESQPNNRYRPEYDCCGIAVRFRR